MSEFEVGGATDQIDDTIRRAFTITSTDEISTTQGWKALAQRLGFVLSSVQFAVPLKFTAELRKP